ncbi:hypothetical protein DPMN_148365 [Dreissena polymorpha]|uniref:Uncharacterized protein n=1 Tax=Dreissena polymorpha TaxID=45954 RepID=A0A9D4J051_DREPO|nr:hypothetical protein DPMN_148365 [Dreissena polymorpha]
MTHRSVQGQSAGHDPQGAGHDQLVRTGAGCGPRPTGQYRGRVRAILNMTHRSVQGQGMGHP